MTSTQPLFDLSGRTALVTGASRGLGRQMAGALARAGADLVITARDAASLADTVAEIEAIGRRAVPLALDLRDEASIREAAAAAEDASGGIDILLNNAGCNIRKPSLEVAWDDWNTVVDTNLRGMFFITQAIARGMVARGSGRITFSSAAATFRRSPRPLRRRDLCRLR